MACTIHVNGKANSLVHKGSGGFAKSTLPDVCKTPSPGGPVPVPYPIIVSKSSDLAKGTKTVKVDGGNMAAIKGSEFSRCMGDEAGTAGGVKSSTNMKEATWITSSPDVKLDGKNACRLSDMMQMNHGNTVCLAGEVQMPVTGPPKKRLKKLADECNKKVNEEEKDVCPPDPSGSICTALGTKKHKCCEDAIKKHNKENPDSKFQSEVAFDANNKALDSAAATTAREAGNAAYDSFMKQKTKVSKISKKAARAAAKKAKVWWGAFKKAGGATCIADVLIVDPPGATPSKTPPPGNIKAAYDFKFNCSGKKKISKKQRDKYVAATGRKVRQVFSPGNKCG